MKSTQLLSVVLSLIMFTGVTAGGIAFADSDEYYDDLEYVIEDYCEMTYDEQAATISDYSELADYEDRLAAACDIDDIDERYDELDVIIDEIIPEVRDDFDDYDKRGYDDYIEDRIERFCEMSDEDKRQLFEDHPRLESFSDRLADYCVLSEDEREDVLDDFVDEHQADFKRHIDSEMRDKLERYCDMSSDEKRKYIAEHDKTTDHKQKMDRFCTMGEGGKMTFIKEHRDEYKAHMMDRYHHMNYDKKHHMNYDRLCTMTESDRAAEVTDVAKLDRINNWCNMTPEERKEYKKEHHGMMKDKMHDEMMGKMHDKMMDCGCHTADDGTMSCPTGMSNMDCPMMGKMHDKMTDRIHDKMRMMDDKHRLKAMIMSKYDVSDERLDEIKMKYREKHGELSDERKMELKMKFKDHMSKTRFHHMTDERKAEIHDRLAEMRAFKAELRDKASDLTVEQKQELREEFIEKAKDLQLAWITPRTQMVAGVDAAEVECREGFSLVMKASNGVAVCLKADTALKMIDRGIVVPAN